MMRNWCAAILRRQLLGFWLRYRSSRRKSSTVPLHLDEVKALPGFEELSARPCAESATPDKNHPRTVIGRDCRLPPRLLRFHSDYTNVADWA